MVSRTLLAALFAATFVTPALSGQCPADMAAIDQALAQNPQLSSEQLEQVKQLRAEGEAAHAAGNHAESMEKLAEAKAILGVE